MFILFYSYISMDQETDDNAMDTSPESYRDSDCVSPSVTHQYTNDIMDNPQVTNQEPDDVLVNPPIKHDEKCTETLNKDNDDPAVADSTTSVPFTSPDQDPGVKTSNKSHEEYKVKKITFLKYVPKRGFLSNAKLEEPFLDPHAPSKKTFSELSKSLKG